jgi:hypothetical protein
LLPFLTAPADPLSTESIRALYNQLSPAEKQLAIAMAKATLQRTTPQEVRA